MTLLIYFLGATIFCTCITDQRQEWDKPADARSVSPAKEEITLGQKEEQKKEQQNESNS